MEQNEPVREELPEITAAVSFVLASIKRAQEIWPRLVSDVKGICGERLPGDDSAILEFSLAVMAVEMEALPNLLPVDQADRIREYVVQYVSDLSSEPWGREVLQDYGEVWKQAVHEVENPLGAIASLLFDRLGCQATTELAGVKYKSPLLLMFFMERIVLCNSGFWKRLIEKFRILP